jgi:SUKH-3 immunity protein of toxin-antitoxin system
MLDETLRPSAEAESILRAAGWSPTRTVDTTAWVEALQRAGNQIFPLAESILMSFGGLDVRSKGAHAASESFDVNPSHWIGMRDVIADAEEVLQHRLFPLGELSGNTMLAILDDGRVISEFQGYVDLLDLLTLGQGAYRTLARNYVPVSNQQSQPS